MLLPTGLFFCMISAEGNERRNMIQRHYNSKAEQLAETLADHMLRNRFAEMHHQPRSRIQCSGAGRGCSAASGV